MDGQNIWWVWMAAALVLAIIEVVVPGYIFLGFAVGAALTAVLVLLVQVSIPTALVIAAVLAGLSYVALRKMLGVQKGQVRIWTKDIND